MCVSDATKMINVGSVHAIASNDTIILKDIPFPLHVNYNGNFNGAPTFLWSPATGLNNAQSQSPTCDPAK
jgi:hypothetical protein